MDGDRLSRGTATGGGGGHALRSPAEATPKKYLPPHLRNQQTSSSGPGPLAPPLHRNGAGRSSEFGPTWRSWDPPPAAATPPRGASLLTPKQQPLPNPSRNNENRILPVRRPESRVVAGRSVNLLVNHFLVKFNPRVTIYHYSLDIRQLVSRGKRPSRKSRNKAGLRLILNKLFLNDQARFPGNRTAYDGEKNLYSVVSLPTGQFEVGLSGEDSSTQTYVVSIKIMNELKLSKLEDYLSGKVPYVPRDILQGMDMVMKENPSRYKISIDRHFYPTSFKDEVDLGHGIAAHRGFQSTLRPTAQGLALCLDCSVMAFRKPLPVVEFLKEHVPEFDGAFLDSNLRRRVANALKGLTVRVTHRPTKQLFTIAGLTLKTILIFGLILLIQKGRIQLLKSAWCNISGRNMGQRYRKELLDEPGQDKLEEKCLARPQERKKTISEMMQDHDGPCGDATRNFGLRVDKNMTSVEGRVIVPPGLKLGAPGGSVDVVKVENEKRQWNLAESSVVDGKLIERWALIDFSSSDFSKLREKEFITNLRNRSSSLGIVMEEPLLYHFTSMREFSSVSRLEELLRSVVQEGSRKCRNKLQIIICVMAEKHHGYKYLKWVSETRIGVVTQCCLSNHANRGDDQFLGNLCVKINAKLGGSNVELIQRLAHFGEEDHVMFIGADVNHPVSKKSTTPSIAAVVATVNWPAVNRYAARVSPQDHRTERILDLGSMCQDLVNTYFQLNKVKPKKIVVFRDGVSEGQFDMVLNEELLDLKGCF